MKRLPAFPSPRLAALAAPSGPFRQILDGYLGLYSSGRAAIYRALAGLRLDTAATVWFPVFHCGVEVDAALALGHSVAFYRIGRNLEVDLEDLERKLRQRPGPVLAIHYFGFPQTGIAALVRLCEDRGVPLIEDCAHALFSRYGGRPLGDFAPLSIFSLRKTLPMHDGGALLVHSGLLARVSTRPFLAPPRGRFSSDPYRIYAKAALRDAVGESVTALYRRLRWGVAEPSAVSAPSSEPQRAQYEAGISWISGRLAASEDPAGIVDARRRNWHALDVLLAAFPGYRKIFPNLPDDVCPLFLPVWVSHREPVIEALQRHGIETFIFGALPHRLLDRQLSQEARDYRDTILCLPVHQQLSTTDMERLAAAFSGAMYGAVAEALP